jgi:hypothetical protein
MTGVASTPSLILHAKGDCPAARAAWEQARGIAQRSLAVSQSRTLPVPPYRHEVSHCWRR